MSTGTPWRCAVAIICWTGLIVPSTFDRRTIETSCVCGPRSRGFQYGMVIEEKGAGDQVFESHGVKLFVDPISIQYLKNAEVDFIDTITGGGFTIKNPNAKSTCGCGSSFSTE